MYTYALGGTILITVTDGIKDAYAIVQENWNGWNQINCSIHDFSGQLDWSNISYLSLLFDTSVGDNYRFIDYLESDTAPNASLRPTQVKIVKVGRP
jgi:hypothetical protein